MSHNLPYLLFFIPLILAILNNFFYNNRGSHYLLVGGIASMLLLSLSFIPSVAQNDYIASNIGVKGASIITEYKVDLLSIIFIILTLFVNLNKSLFYRRSYIGIASRGVGRFSYVTHFLHLFGIMGVLMTNNIINLLIFMEIYSFTFYALISDSKNYTTSVLSFKYFKNGAIGSIFSLLSCLMLYLIFGTGDIDTISQNMYFVTEQNKLVTSVLFLAFLFGIFFKHFTIWLYITKVRRNSKTSNLSVISAIFTKITLGIYLLLKAFYVIFERELTFDIVNIDILLKLFGTILVVYSFTKAFKRKNLRLTSLFFAVMSIGMMLIGLSLGNYAGIKSVLVYIINYNTAILGFFLITSLFLYSTGHVDYRLIDKLEKNNLLVFLPFTVIIASVLCLPLTMGFFADWYLFLGIIQNTSLIDLTMIIPLTMKWVLCVSFAIKYGGQLFSSKVNEEENYDNLSNKPTNYDYNKVIGTGELVNINTVQVSQGVSIGMICAVIIISFLMSFWILDGVDYVAEYLIANPVTGMRV